MLNKFGRAVFSSTWLSTHCANIELFILYSFVCVTLFYFCRRYASCCLSFIIMESVSSNAEVRLAVTQSVRTLTSSTDCKDIIAALQTLISYLDDRAESQTSAAQREEFRRAHYSRTLQFLVSNIQADWLWSLSATQRAELWDHLFLEGPPDQALLVLMDAITELRWGVLAREVVLVVVIFCHHQMLISPHRPSMCLDHLVSITEKFLHSGRIADLLWSSCLQSAPSDSPQFRETLLSRISALPDITANKLHPNIRPPFLPQQYYSLLATEMLNALQRTCQALRG